MEVVTLEKDWPAPDARLVISAPVAGLALALFATMVVWMVVPFGTAAGLLASSTVGLIGGLAYRARLPQAPVLSMVAAAVLLGSPIVPAEGRYLPVLASMIAVAITMVSEVRRGRALRFPSRWISVLVALYFANAAAATIFSIDVRSSVVYLVGIGASLAIAFVAVPTLLDTAASRLAFVVMAGAVGVVLAIMSLGLWMVGPLTTLGEPLGIYLITELRVGDELTGIIVPRGAGPYLTPGYQALNLSIGLVALLSVRPFAGRARLLVEPGIGLVVLAILLTMARGGWLVAASGSLAVAMLLAFQVGRRLPQRRRYLPIDRPAVASFAVLAVALALLLANVLGADARYDLAAIRYGDAAAGTSEEDIVSGPGSKPDPVTGGVVPPVATSTPVPVRGGAESSSRGVIWSASLAAIAERPIQGHGPGTNALAIAPFLVGPNAVYQGLTSHSTWLRTAVEMGVGGLAALVAIIVATAFSVVRARRTASLLNEPSSVALLAATAALVVGQTTETLLLGGLTYASMFWAMAIGLLVARPTAISARPSTLVPASAGSMVTPVKAGS